MPDEVPHRHEEEAPSPREAVHLPGPSFLPVVTAAGVAIALVGIVISWVVVAAGAAVALVAILRWVGDTRRDISELPLER